MKQTTRMLDVPLTDDEVAIKAQELAAKLQAFDVAEEEKKERTKDLSDQMKTLRGEARVLRIQVATKKARKLVDCWQEPNVVRRVWELRRADTGEVIETFPMSQQDIDEARQMDLEQVPVRVRDADVAGA